MLFLIGEDEWDWFFDFFGFEGLIEIVLFLVCKLFCVFVFVGVGIRLLKLIICFFMSFILINFYYLVDYLDYLIKV